MLMNDCRVQACDTFIGLNRRCISTTSSTIAGQSGMISMWDHEIHNKFLVGLRINDFPIDCLLLNKRGILSWSLFNNDIGLKESIKLLYILQEVSTTCNNTGYQQEWHIGLITFIHQCYRIEQR